MLILGSIVNTSSLGAKKAVRALVTIFFSNLNLIFKQPMAAFYCMSKAALDKWTACLAVELGPQGVRVNNIR